MRELEVMFEQENLIEPETVAQQEFIFFLIHRDGYNVLAAARKESDQYIMFKVHHPRAQVYNQAGRRKPVQYYGWLGGSEIQRMLETGEWDIAGENPYE